MKVFSKVIKNDCIHTSHPSVLLVEFLIQKKIIIVVICSLHSLSQVETV